MLKNSGDKFFITEAVEIKNFSVYDEKTPVNFSMKLWQLFKQI